MSSRKGTKRSIIEIEHPGQEQTLGQRERVVEPDTTSPVLTRQDRPSSYGLRPAAAMNNGTGASATDRTSYSPSASGAALVRAGSDDNDRAGTPSEDDDSEMAAAGPMTPTQSRTISQSGPEAMSSSTKALDRTMTRADPSPEANSEAMDEPGVRMTSQCGPPLELRL